MRPGAKEIGKVCFIGGAPGWEDVLRSISDALDGEQLGPIKTWAPMPVPSSQSVWDMIAKEGPYDLLINYAPSKVPAKVIASAENPINLHLGPPRWPGRGSCSWALLHGDHDFGITAHRMTDEIDAGPIVHVTYFPIDPAWDAEALHRHSIAKMPGLAWRLVKACMSNGKILPLPYDWDRTSMKLSDLREAMRLVSPRPGFYLPGGSAYGDIKPQPLDHFIRAFGYTGKPGPTLVVDGREFVYTKKESITSK